MKRPGPVPGGRQSLLTGTIQCDRSGCLRRFPQEHHSSLATGLKHEPRKGLRLALAVSCEGIRHAITFRPTESFRLSGVVRPEGL